MTAKRKDGGMIMFLLGWPLLIGGLCLTGWGFFADATFATDPDAYGLVSERMYNLGLITEKLVMLIGGCTAAIMGLILVVGANIVESAATARTGKPVDPLAD